MCLMCGCTSCCCKDERDSYERRQDQENIGIQSLPRTEYIHPNVDKLEAYTKSFNNLDVLRAARKEESDYIAYFDNIERYIFLQKQVANIGDNPEKITGWKIHVSINPTKISQAWGIIMPILIEYGVHMFKVAKPLCCANYKEEGFQPGKEIVVYGASSREDLDWLNILQRIYSALMQNGIEQDINPTFRQSSDNTIGPAEPKIIIDENQRGYFYLSDDSKSIDEFSAWISQVSFDDGEAFLKINNLAFFVNPRSRETAHPISFQMY